MYFNNLKSLFNILNSVLFRIITCIYPEIFKFSSGIISAYNGQTIEIDNYGRIMEDKSKSQISTVDGFQGKEKDIIIFNCVRSRTEKGVGFLSDCRRMNVAFTRARNSFWLIGNFATLSSNTNWNEAIEDLKKRDRIISFRKPLERSLRRAIHWSMIDCFNFSFDGEVFPKAKYSLYEYISINKISIG